MSQINTRLRTYNYHIVSRENKNAKLALAEAQKALRQAESELEKAEAEVKEAQTEANAFQLIADAIKFKTSINQLIIKVEAEVSEEGAIPVFKGETGTTPNEKELDIYLMGDNWAGYKKRQNPTNDKGTEEDTHFCFRVDENTTPESFTGMLDDLIAQAEADKQAL